VLLGRGLCDELITRPEESYRLWHVVCDQDLVDEEAIAIPRWAAVPEKIIMKVKFTLEQATKAQSGSRGIALLFP
jgi:hypothetical protein